MGNLADAPRASLSATLYRIVHSGADPLSTDGSERNGGRYNSPGTRGVLYSSLEAATALAEINKGLQARGIDPRKYRSGDWWLYEVEFHSKAVLDLTNSAVLQQLNTTREAIVGGDISVTRQLGKDAFDAGFEAILAPSAARAGSNVVIFLGSLAVPPVVRSSAPIALS